MQWRKRFRAVALLAAICGASPSVLADRTAAEKALIQRGGLSAGQARHVIKDVSARMAKSASAFARDDDPIRTAMSQALFGTAVPGDRTQRARVRLRLFSGLTDWALPVLFGSGTNTLMDCQHIFGLSQGHCGALAMASRRLADRSASSSRAAIPADTMARAERPHVPSSGRFSGRDVNQQGAVAARNPAARSAAPATARARLAPAVPVHPRASARSQRRVAAPATGVSVKRQQSTREAYLARRKAYLDRQRARADALRKQREERFAASQVVRGPAAESAEGEHSTETQPKVVREAKEPQAKQDNELADFVEGLLD